ncbi:MAG: alpha/beta fold hydrolase [Candidatus Pacebacteria bacterium]|nr:alpha/beta fold hydrolase [Candidatus Paceibacterota bacterium]
MKKSIYPELEWFSEWERKSGERMPDLSQFRSIPDLPPLLEFYDGRPVRNIDDWREREKEIKHLLCNYLLGSFPHGIPALSDVRTIGSRHAPGAKVIRLRLVFDTPNNAGMEIEVLKPDGKGPFPVFMTQTNHRRWGLIALSRGYLTCIYPGCDIDDQTGEFKKAYPDCDWGLIARRAWLGSRALDYVLTLPEADCERVAITGHSRNGKQAIIAAAFDPRIKAVVSSSSGSGGACPYRLVSESAFEESVEFTTRLCPEWFHPRLRYFTGHEDLLPIDCHCLLGLIAPRHCLLSTAMNDGCETSYAIERSCVAAREVYRFLGQTNNIGIRWRHGGHDTCAEDIQSYLDFFDKAFGLDDTFSFSPEPFHLFDWNQWRDKQDESTLAIPEAKNWDVKRRVCWGLGEFPPETDVPGEFSYGIEAPHKSALMRRETGNELDILRTPVTFGGYIAANLYHCPGFEGHRPVVVWFHPYSYSTGYVGAYMVGERIYERLAQLGYVVMAYDQIGFGTRVEEGGSFYKRYPKWSRLGKMVADARGALDFLVSDRNMLVDRDIQAVSRLPEFDRQRILAVGYSLGGMVALYAAALDQRIAGVASFCGITPLGTDNRGGNAEALARLWKWHAIQPKLGICDGVNKQVPYDFDDILTLVAPRPCLVYSALHDRESNAEAVARCLDTARQSWKSTGAENLLQHCGVDDYNRFQTRQLDILEQWLAEVTTTGPVSAHRGEPRTHAHGALGHE